MCTLHLMRRGVLKHVTSYLNKRNYRGGERFIKSSINNAPTDKAKEGTDPVNINPGVKTEICGHATNLNPSGTPTSPDNLESKRNAAERFHKCSQCNLMFVGLSQLIRHETIYHMEMTKDPSQEYHEGRQLRFKCDICMWTYKTHDERKNHRSGHKTVQKIGCNFCAKHLTATGRLRRHLRMVHNMKHATPKSFKFRVCQETFSTQVEADNHERRSEHVPKQICRVCGKHFSAAGRRDNEKVHSSKPTKGESDEGVQSHHHFFLRHHHTQKFSDRKSLFRMLEGLDFHHKFARPP